MTLKDVTLKDVTLKDMTLKDLAQSVMLGTERGQSVPAVSSADGALAEVLKQLGQRVDESVEARVLSMAAVLAPYEEAGRRTLDVAGRVLPPECPSEDLPVCPAGAVTVLQRTLGEQPTLLAEWLALAAARGVRVPPSILPRLLEAGRRDRDLRGDLARVVGRRGLWLAAQNKDWSYALADAATEPDEKDWQEGRLEARKGYLTALRAHDPQAARRSLEEVWNEDNAATRADLLSALQVGLGMDDEPFLENCLDDRSKQVRRVALRLLGSLPDSRWGQRMAQRCGRFVRIKRKMLRASLEIDLPEELDASMQRDGLSETSDLGSLFGKGAARLFHLVAATPTSFWSRELDLEPEALLKALKRHSWSKPMTAGLFQAAVRQQDADLCVALLDGKVDKDLVDEEEMIRLLPATRRDEFLISRLRHASDDDVRGLLFKLDRITGEGEWSASLADAAVTRFAHLMRHSEGQQDWHLHSFLATLAARAPVAMASDALTRLPRPAKPIPSLEEKLNDFNIVLDLRTRMHKELAP